MKFKVGDRVERSEPRSYTFPGVVIAVGMKLDGETELYSVECTAAGCEGMVHVFPDRHLQLIEDKPRKESLLDWVLTFLR